METQSNFPSSKYLFAAIIIAVSFGVYANTLPNGFVYDDNDQVLKNSWIRDIRHLPDIFFSSVWSFMGDQPPSVYYYRPMMHFIYTIEYHLFGLNPLGWHLVNIILHAGNSIVVFLISSLLLSRSSSFSGHGSKFDDIRGLFPAFMVAILFTVHPINTEVVAWISAVPELSFTLFCLLSFYFYMNSSSKGSESRVTPSCPLSVAFFFLALLSKETAIMLPILILAYDYYIRPANYPSGLFPTLIKRYLPFILVIGTYIPIRIYALWDMVLQRPEPSYLGNFNYITNIIQLIYKYFSKLLLPINLNIFHDFRPANSIMDIMDIIALPVILSYLLLFYLAREKGKLIIFAIAWIVAFLTPALYTLGITENPFAERYLYLPSVGFAILLTVAVNGINRMNIITGKTGIYLSISIFIIVAGLYSTETAKRNFIWKDDITLWTDSLRKTPNTSTVHYNLGVVYQNRGLLEDARKEYQESLRLKPRAADAHYQLGNIYVSWYLLDSAIVEFQEALRIKPDYQEAQRELEKVLNLRQLQQSGG